MNIIRSVLSKQLALLLIRKSTKTRSELKCSSSALRLSSSFYELRGLPSPASAIHGAPVGRHPKPENRTGRDANLRLKFNYIFPEKRMGCACVVRRWRLRSHDNACKSFEGIPTVSQKGRFFICQCCWGVAGAFVYNAHI